MAEKRQPQSTTPQEAFVLAYVGFLVKILELKFNVKKNKITSKIGNPIRNIKK
jgi:hypothetical protein